MDGLVVVGKSGMMMKPSNAIGRVMTPSKIKSPKQTEFQSKHEVNKTSKLTLPSGDATSAVEAIIDALQNRPCEY